MKKPTLNFLTKCLPACDKGVFFGIKTLKYRNSLEYSGLFLTGKGPFQIAIVSLVENIQNS